MKMPFTTPVFTQAKPLLTANWSHQPNFSQCFFFIRNNNIKFANCKAIAA